MERSEPGLVVTPGPAAPAVVETHSSVIVFVDDRAYKARKPVDLGFLDNRTVEARRRVSRAEVELNSRMAPDVYHGVFEVHDADGEVVDHVVVMRRLPAERSLATVVDRDAGTAARMLDVVAEQLARLHAASPQHEEIHRAGRPETVAGLWRESLDHMRALSVGQDAPEVLDDLDALSSAWLAGRGRLLHERIADGRIVDGHGDLLAADIYCLDDGPRVIDCLEFDDRLRFGDALLDAGFLVMDLDRRGHPDLARRFLDAYRRASGDEAPQSLLHLYTAYRAVVRSKVSAIRAEQSSGPESGRAAREALELAAWAVDALLRARVRLVLVGGVSGSGKSTLARTLAGRLDATLVRSDVVRKELAGLDPQQTATSAPGTGLYEPGSTERTYTEMLDRASELLATGHSVVLDATWLDVGQRIRAETAAADARAELVEIECTAPREVLIDRIARRRRAGGDVSDATEEVLDEQLAARRVWPDALQVDTDTELDVRDPESVGRWMLRTLGPLGAPLTTASGDPG